MDALVVVSPSASVADVESAETSVGLSSAFSVETMLVETVVDASFLSLFLLTRENTSAPMRTPRARNRKIQAHFTRPDERGSSSSYSSSS